MTSLPRPPATSAAPRCVCHTTLSAEDAGQDRAVRQLTVLYKVVQALSVQAQNGTNMCLFPLLAIIRPWTYDVSTLTTSLDQYTQTTNKQSQMTLTVGQPLLLQLFSQWRSPDKTEKSQYGNTPRPCTSGSDRPPTYLRMTGRQNLYGVAILISR